MRQLTTAKDVKAETFVSYWHQSWSLSKKNWCSASESDIAKIIHVFLL